MADRGGSAPHTPGEWRISSLQRWYVISGDEPEPICALAEFSEHGDVIHIFPDDDEEKAEANAKLIAAAPDMEAALQLVLTKLAHKLECMICRPSTEWKENGSWAVDKCCCEIATVEAALRKARGE